MIRAKPDTPGSDTASRLIAERTVKLPVPLASQEPLKLNCCSDILEPSHTVSCFINGIDDFFLLVDMLPIPETTEGM